MTTVYNTTAGIKLTMSATQGWMIQNWWKGETEWTPLATATKEVLKDLRKTTIENMPEEVTMLFYNELDARISNEITELMVDVALNNPLGVDEKKVALDGMIASMTENQNKVESWSIDEGLEMIGKMAAIYAMLGVKMVDNFFGDVTIDTVIMKLRTHGHTSVEVHFPCGTKFELVIHHRENHSIHAFGYKL